MLLSPLSLLLFSFAVLTRGHLLPSLVPSVPPSSHFDAIAVRPHRQSSPDWRRRRRSSSRDLRAASANEREREGETVADRRRERRAAGRPLPPAAWQASRRSRSSSGEKIWSSQADQDDPCHAQRWVSGHHDEWESYTSVAD